jgi:hypothetical protein
MPLVSCQPETTLLSCRDLQLDELACGECGVTCESSVLCVEGACDATVEWVRIYGAETIGGRPATQGRLVADSQGNLFAAIGLTPGVYRELPDGQDDLWGEAAGANAILKFDPQGSFQWALPVAGALPPLAVAGSSLWVLGGASGSTTFFGQDFNLASGHAAMTMAVQLSADGQQVSDFFQVDHLTTSGGSLEVLSNGTELWMVRKDTSGMQPAPGAYGAVIYVRGGSSVGVPGRLLGVAEEGGDLVVLTDLAKNESYSFGGDTLTTGEMGARGIARYSSALAHESSFLIDWHWLNEGVFVASSSSYFILSLPQKPFFQQYDGTGTLLATTNPPFDTQAATISHGRIFSAGHVLTNGGTVGEREFHSFAALLATFDETTQELERAITFEPELPTDLLGPAGILDMVVTDAGASAVVLTSFKRGILFRDQHHDFGNNTSGIALVKVKLYSQ